MTANALLAAACDVLRQLVADIDAGNDAIPAQRFAVEALLNQALAEGIAPSVLRAEIVALLPDPAALRIEARDGRTSVALQLWQQPAPVVPSTSD